MSPPLVVAYALSGRMDIDLYNEPLGIDKNGQDVYLRHIWPTQAEVSAVLQESIQPEMFRQNYAQVFAGDNHWNAIDVPQGALFAWDPASTYVKNPPYFDAMPKEAPETVPDIRE